MKRKGKKRGESKVSKTEEVSFGETLKKKSRQEEIFDRGWQLGYAEAQRQSEQATKELQRKLDSRQAAQDNIKAARDFLAMAGQTIQAFAQVCLSQTDSQGKQA